jgi:hypothetical protein
MLDQQELFKDIGVNLFFLHPSSLGVIFHFVSFLHLLVSAKMSDQPHCLQTTFGYKDNDPVNVLFETSALTGVTTLSNQLGR